jgi:hypothetical protein
MRDRPFKRDTQSDESRNQKRAPYPPNRKTWNGKRLLLCHLQSIKSAIAALFVCSTADDLHARALLKHALLAA